MPRRRRSSRCTAGRSPTRRGGANGGRGSATTDARCSRTTAVSSTANPTTRRCAAAFRGPTPRRAVPTSSIAPSVPSSCGVPSSSSSAGASSRVPSRHQEISRMRLYPSSILLALMTITAGSIHAQSDAALARARRILRAAPLIDGHNDLPWEIRGQDAHPHDVAAYDLRGRTPGHTDLARLVEGQVGGQFWSIYLPGDIADSGFARVQLEQFDIARRMIERYPDKLAFAWSAADVEREFKRGRVASMLGMEGGHAIENSLGALRAYRALGARYMTLTHNVTLDWADAASDTARHGGLTAFGREVVREMNRLGMLVDRKSGV